MAKEKASGKRIGVWSVAIWILLRNCIIRLRAGWERVCHS